jgi:hypothetical protein
MNHLDWYNPHDCAVWTTTDLAGLAEELKALGFDGRSTGPIAEQRCTPGSTAGGSALELAVNRTKLAELRAALELVIRAAQSSSRPMELVIHVLSHDNCPLGGIDEVGSEELGPLYSDLSRYFRVESDVRSVVWSAENGRRELFRHRRTLRCSTVPASPAPRPEVIDESLSTIAPRVILDLSVGSTLDFSRARDRWVTSARLRQVGERLQVLEWQNGRIVLNRSKVVGKELIFRGSKALMEQGENVPLC